VILAGILLKLGGYGILRILLFIFSNGCFFFLPLIYVLGLLSILYASLTAIRQLDLKRIIAYSSIAHMNLILLGLFSNMASVRI
jgi:NADH:ubiquinone oxidoreductase subunit 4 (subunit M)